MSSYLGYTGLIITQLSEFLFFYPFSTFQKGYFIYILINMSKVAPTKERPLPEPPPVPKEVCLSDRIGLLRNLLPPIIVLVVVGIEMLIVQLPTQRSQLIAHLLFYGLIGPAATYYSMDWIAQGTRARERAENELRHLYGELSASHGRLRAVQEMMRDLTDAPDMAAVVDIAAKGAIRVTGATHAKVVVAGGVSSSARGHTLLASPSADLHLLQLDIPSGGQLTLHFDTQPSKDMKALAEALAAEVTSSVEAARQRTLDIMTLYSVDQSIRAERNMRRLLGRVTRNMTQRLNVSARAAYLADQDGVLRLEYGDEYTGNAMSGTPAPAFAAKVAEQGTPQIALYDQARDVFPSALSVLGLPMRDEEGLLGVLMLGDQRADAFSDAPIPLLAFMAGQASLAVRNARAYLYSEEVAISDERARIAREIHDGVAQSLAFTALKLDLVFRQIRKNPDLAETEVKAASAVLREQIREVRRSIFALRPIDLERYGLEETMRRYVFDFGEQNETQTTIEVTGEIHLSPSDEAVIFRLLQESLNNIAKHAEATEVKVSLHGAHRATLRIEDNGKGFDLEAVSGRVSTAGGLGLTQMRERMEARGGEYRVLSSPGHGTVVEAELPQL